MTATTTAAGKQRACTQAKKPARYFALNQKDLVRVSVLVSSKSVELSIAIAQHLSQTGKLIQIYSDGELYEARRTAAARR